MARDEPKETRVWVGWDQYNRFSSRVLCDDEVGADALLSILLKEPLVRWIHATHYNPEHPKGFVGEKIMSWNQTEIKRQRALRSRVVNQNRFTDFGRDLRIETSEEQFVLKVSTSESAVAPSGAGDRARRGKN